MGNNDGTAVRECGGDRASVALSDFTDFSSLNTKPTKINLEIRDLNKLYAIGK